MAREERSAALTVAEVLPLTEPEAAVMVTEPRLRAVAKPLTVIDATLLSEELQVTVPVMSCVVPSEKVPVAVNCCSVPSGIDAFAGVTVIETKIALVTVRVALEERLPEDAEIVEVPGASPFASPSAPFTLMLATDGFDETQLTDDVMFCVLPSVKVPVAANWTVVPGAMEALEGETEIETRAGGVTVRDVLPLTPEDAALILVEPTATLVAKPEVEMVAALIFDDAHVTELVRSCLLPSL